MKLTNERIFAKDTDMMFWQQYNCTQCAKAVWYNARLGRCPKHNCALQRDMEAHAGGEMEINERSFRVLHGVKRCPLFPITEEELAKFVEEKRPSLKGKNYNIAF